ncbi:MAG: hypothetical protein UBAL2_82410138 [Leptospirillum rubarum]|nr:MAG: hypothetical protein UBAL2_82410138 [Leptospirillum rubarum]
MKKMGMGWILFFFFVFWGTIIHSQTAFAVEEQFFGEVAPTLGGSGTAGHELGTGFGFGWTLGDWVLPDFKVRGGVQWVLFPGVRGNSDNSLEAIPITFGVEYIPPDLGSSSSGLYGYGLLDAGVFPAVQTNQTFSSFNPVVDVGLGGNFPVTQKLSLFVEVKAALVMNTFYRFVPQTNGQLFFYVPVSVGFLF